MMKKRMNHGILYLEMGENSFSTPNLHWWLGEITVDTIYLIHNKNNSWGQCVSGTTSVLLRV